MRRLLSPILPAAFVVLTLACGPNGSNDAGPNRDAGDVPSDGSERQSATLEIGILDGDDQFDSIESGEKVEVTVGFQGLIFIDFALLGPEEGPSKWSGTAEVHFREGDHDFTLQKSRIRFDRPHDEGRLATGFRVPFSDLSVVRGADLELVVDLESQGWSAHGSADFRTLVDDESDGSAADAGLDADARSDAESVEDAT